MKEHTYTVDVSWQGNTGDGTTSYTAYQRDFVIEAPGKAAILAPPIPPFAATPNAGTRKICCSPRFLRVTNFGICTSAR